MQICVVVFFMGRTLHKWLCALACLHGITIPVCVNIAYVFICMGDLSVFVCAPVLCVCAYIYIWEWKGCTVISVALQIPSMPRRHKSLTFVSYRWGIGAGYCSKEFVFVRNVIESRETTWCWSAGGKYVLEISSRIEVKRKCPGILYTTVWRSMKIRRSKTRWLHQHIFALTKDIFSPLWADAAQRCWYQLPTYTCRR